MLIKMLCPIKPDYKMTKLQGFVFEFFNNGKVKAVSIGDTYVVFNTDLKELSYAKMLKHIGQYEMSNHLLRDMLVMLFDGIEYAAFTRLNQNVLCVLRENLVSDKFSLYDGNLYIIDEEIGVVCALAFSNKDFLPVGEYVCSSILCVGEDGKDLSNLVDLPKTVNFDDWFYKDPYLYYGISGK